jgi:hypothetical protein
VAGAGGLGDGAAVRQRHGRGYREGQASPGQQPVLSPDLSRGQVLADPQEPAAIPGDHLEGLARTFLPVLEGGHTLSAGARPPGVVVSRSGRFR